MPEKINEIFYGDMAVNNNVIVEILTQHYITGWKFPSFEVSPLVGIM